VPRAEPADGLASGKVVKLDRVEWTVLAGSLHQIEPLQQGEVDLIDQLPHDQDTDLEHAPGVVIDGFLPIDSYASSGRTISIRRSNNPKGTAGIGAGRRPARIHERCLRRSAVVARVLVVLCLRQRQCTETGAELITSRIWRAPKSCSPRRLQGREDRFDHHREIPSIAALGDVTADNLRKTAVNVELAVSDWGTMVARRAKRHPPGQGGWNIFHTTVGGTLMSSPVTLSRSIRLRRRQVVRLAVRRQKPRIAQRLYPRCGGGAQPRGARGPPPATVGNAARYSSRQYT